jgi:hypothetical protein
MIALYLLFLLLGLSSAQTAEKVGDVFPIQFASKGTSDIVGTDTPLGKRYVLTHPGATYIALHFSKLALVRGDAIEVSDADGGQAYTLIENGKGKGAAFWSQHIKGDTIILNTFTSGRDRSFFEIDEYAAGFESFFETICGIDDKANAACYSSSFPNAYSTSRPVARLLINGRNLCTGFLVSGANHLLTNNHCIQNTTDALNTDYEFMSEAPTCDSLNSQLSYRGTIFDGATFIQTNVALDYTLVQINLGDPATLYGFLELDDHLAAIGGQVYIPQHAMGKAKQLAIFSTETADAIDGFCHINKSGNYGCGGSASTNVFYLCDTEGGSSGSPVISMATNKVVGLHKCGGCSSGNHGTSAHIIRNEVASFILPPATPMPINAPTIAVPPPTAAPVSAPIPAPVSAPAPVGTTISSFCGDGICDIFSENCVTCPSDCNGVQDGKQNSRFCCGCGGINPVGCANSACNSGAFFCDTSKQCTASAPAPTPIASPVQAPTPIASPIQAPVPVAAPIQAPTPIASPIQAPVKPPTSCLASGTRCISNSECCVGVCKANGTCK